MSKSLSRIEKKQGEKVRSHSKIQILLMVTVCLAYLTATCQVAIIRSEIGEAGWNESWTGAGSSTKNLQMSSVGRRSYKL